MSTFAVFGMTRELALLDARKNVKTTRKTPQGEVAIGMSEWLQLCEKRADDIMAGAKTRQISPLFDAPQYAEQFITIARKSCKCRDMHIKAKSVLKDAFGRPIINKKTGAPKVGWTAYGANPDEAAA